MIPGDLYDVQLLAHKMWERQSAAVDMLEHGYDLEHVQELAKCALLLDDFAGDIYEKWQKLGGTSDIKSVCLNKYYEIAKLEALECDCDITLDDDLPCRVCEEKELEEDAAWFDDVADARTCEKFNTSL